MTEVPQGYASSTDVIVSFTPASLAVIVLGVGMLAGAFLFRRERWARGLALVGAALIVGAVLL